MRLAAVEDVLKFVRFDDIPDISAAFDTALLTASVSLSALLRTGFDRITKTDYFYVEHSEYIGAEYSTYLELTHGFVDSAEDFTIVYAETKTKVDDDDDQTDLSDYVVTDYVKGKLFIQGIDLTNLWVKVTYTAGFELTDAEDPLYDGVPEWLKRAGVVQAIMEFDRMNPDFRKENSGVRINLTELQAHLNGAVEKHIRYMPYCLSPVM